MSKKCVLVITDGIGANPDSNDTSNAFAFANKPNYEWLFKNANFCYLKTSGLAVGLPDGQMGNSEVGHMTIGAGRVLYQNLVKIDKALENGELAKNPELVKFLNKHERVHILGLYSDGGVHSHLRHFDGLIKICKKANKKCIIHAITDGRDTSPSSGADFIKHLSQNHQIATICGRFYAMDRDKRYERVKMAYEVIANNENLISLNPYEYIKNNYENKIFDEFIKPASFYDFGGVKNNDGIICVNFRNDRMRELCMAFGDNDFSEFKRDGARICKNLLTMTRYDENFNYPVIFNADEIENTLSQIISDSGLKQLHTAETEKYAHVTFFFNGGKEEILPNETRVLVPSPKVKTYDEMPQMSAPAVCEAVLKGMDSNIDFIVVNFANGDMVGHTGDFQACKKAVECVDECLGKIIKKAKEKGYEYMQISDHGNCEALRTQNGEPLTNHTIFDVFCFIVASNKEKFSLKNNCGLSNVAPTVLKLMGLEIPRSMDSALF